MTYTLILTTALIMPTGGLCVSGEPGTYTIHTAEPLPGVPKHMEFPFDKLSPIGDPLGELLTAYAKGDAWTDDGPKLDLHDPGRAVPSYQACE